MAFRFPENAYKILSRSIRLGILVREELPCPGGEQGIPRTNAPSKLAVSDPLQKEQNEGLLAYSLTRPRSENQRRASNEKEQENANVPRRTT
jgi:hypothetical protein